MRIQLCHIGLIGALAVTGCDCGTPGGPGVSTPQEQTSMRAENTFRIDVPALGASIKQGETKSFAIAIKRNKNFSDDVRLTFENIPNGMTLDPMNPIIHTSDEEVKITMKAADDAALGDFTVKVVGSPTVGPDATNTLKISVNKK